jgi:Uncharacterized enzyme of heme biosynthesis
MKQSSLIVVGFLMLLSCQTGSISKKLTEVDSLVFKEEYDSAYQMISSIDETTIKNHEDQAHYNLLKVQTGYLANKPATSPDSLLDEVIDYYQKHNNSEKLADAYYYKAVGYSMQKDFKQSIQFYKKAEVLANENENLHQQYKITEGISFVNRMSKKYDLQLKYAKKAYSLAKALDKKNWVAYSCYTIQYAYLYLGYKDSAYIFLQEIPLYIRYAKKSELPVLLTTLGYYLRDDHPEEAKQYLREALSYHELTSTYAYLAEVCYHEGKPEEAYQYWKKALVLKDSYPKDNIIRNLIEFDLERGKTDSISDMVTQIFEIRDSIDAKLRNDTIKDLQTRFDHETAMHAKDQAIIRWQWGIMILALALLAGIGLYVRRRYLNKIKLQGYQMQINDCLNQIDALKATGSDAQKKIEELNQQISDIMDNRAPGLNKGRVLYDDIVANKDISNWSKEDETLFLEYYTATNYRTMQQLMAIPREDKLTNHRLIFLILQEMGKSELDILRILSISKETLRTLRHRTKPKE